MSFLDKFIDTINTGDEIVDAVVAQLHVDMKDDEKERLKLVACHVIDRYKFNLLKLAQEEQNDFNDMVKNMEGTASDLDGAGFLGKIVIFLRGAQRPIWGFAVLWLDIKVFSGGWCLYAYGEAKSYVPIQGMDIQSAFWLINFLVLGFLFGERALRNVMPLFQARIQK